MSTKTATKQTSCKTALSTALLLGALIGLPSVNAATVFFDDFEDTNLDGWNVSGTDGSSGVEFANESNWAFAYTSKSPRYSLTREFAYDGSQVLSFDFHPVYANQGRGNYGETMHAAGGFTVSFENSFNTTLGSVSFVFRTPGYTLPSNSYEIPDSADFFEASMSDWADLALVDPSTNIAAIVLDFWVDGHTAQIPAGSAATAKVRFDNVIISDAGNCTCDDIDGNGVQDALTDGILIMRYMFGFRGEALTQGAVASDCTICENEEIEACLEQRFLSP